MKPPPPSNRNPTGSFKDTLVLEGSFKPVFRSLIADFSRKAHPGAKEIFVAANDRDGAKLSTSHIDISIQRCVADYTVHGESGILSHHETKIESKTSPNLFIETFSNRSENPAMLKNGWFFTTDADYLWYGFADTGNVYVLSFTALRKQLLSVVMGNDGLPCTLLGTLREVVQSKHRQKNLTVGRLLPIASAAKMPGVVVSRCSLKVRQEATP